MQEKEMLQRASNEIKHLREANALMAGRLEVFDTMMRLFHTSPNYGSGGMAHPDVVYEIDNHLENLKKEENGTNERPI